MLAEALRLRHVLEKHGLAETILRSLQESLDELDRITARATAAHLRQVQAGAGLDQVGAEVVRIVRGMDRVNRYRFENEAGLMAQWESASNVIAAPRSMGDAAA